MSTEEERQRKWRRQRHKTLRKWVLVWRFMLHFLQFPYVYFCFFSLSFSLSSSSLSLFQRSVFICTVFVILCAFDITSRHLRVYQSVWCSRSGIHLAFIYSDTINHKRITSHTENASDRETKKKWDGMNKSQRTSERMNENRAIPFIATDEWSICDERTIHTYRICRSERKKTHKCRERCKEDEANREQKKSKKIFKIGHSSCCVKY